MSELRKAHIMVSYVEPTGANIRILKVILSKLMTNVEYHGQNLNADLEFVGDTPLIGNSYHTTHMGFADPVVTSQIEGESHWWTT